MKTVLSKTENNKLDHFRLEPMSGKPFEQFREWNVHIFEMDLKKGFGRKSAELAKSFFHTKEYSKVSIKYGTHPQFIKSF